MASTLRSTRVIFQLPNKGTWFENIAVRPNGVLLATRVDVPEVWAIDPASGAGTTLHSLPAPINSITGITELSPDVYAIGAGRYDLAKGAVEGSWEIWTFSLASQDGDAASTPRKVVSVPRAGLVNGLTTLDANTILAADSTHGSVYKIDLVSNTCTLALSDELMDPGPEPFIPIGINGIKIRDGYLYFTNSARALFCRLPIDASAKTAGQVEVLAKGVVPDDLAFDTDGSALIMAHPQNIVVRVLPGSSEVITVAGKADSLEVAGGTACAFGRKDGEHRVLYAVTAGGLSSPVNGETEPAKVVAIDLS